MLDVTEDADDEKTVAARASLPTVPASRHAAAEGAPQPGALIGRYVVLFELGAGAMGVVLAAYDPQLDRKVALKLLKTREGDRTKAQARLQREAQALAKLDHPNVVGVHDVGVHEGRLFVGMEFVEGQTLGEWMKSAEKPRPWQEVVRVFSEAGLGLAAAHEAGLVHRDFKPDNVMLGEDGRVRVMDFGLARAGENEEGARAAAPDALVATNPSALDSHLTQTGTLLGTPAYMSLEQWRGRSADSRSDQFSYCVALYEALYGERPFLGPTLSALMMSVGKGEVLPAPKSSTVPAWLRRVVLRALRPEPNERWPSMTALLTALADDPSRRRRKWWTAAAVFAVLASGAWGAATAIERDARTCKGMEDRLEGVWDDARRAELQAAFDATGLSYAPATWEKLQPWLDDYAAAWVVAREEACEATHRGEQSGKLLDLRMACLDDRLGQLQATVDVLAEADDKVVDKAVQAVASLPTLDRCSDIEALTADLPPPDDPEVAERVEALEQRLAKAKALLETGKYPDGLEVATAVASEAQKLDYEPLKARAWLIQGELQHKAGDLAGAEATLKQAYDRAVAMRMPTEAAAASAILVYVVGKGLGRRDDGRAWAEHAAPLAEAARADGARASYLTSLGSLALSEGEYEEARRHNARALAIREEALGPEHPHVASSCTNLANAAYSEGKYEEARRHQLRALAIWEETLGPEHPNVASSYNNLGATANAEGKHEEARRYHLRALEIRIEALGPNHPRVANSYGNLGNLANSEGKYEEARVHHQRALTIFEASLGPAHPNAGLAHNNLGVLANLEGKHEEAREHYERALTIFENALGLEHPHVAHPLTGLGTALLGQNEAVEALPHLERALAIHSAHEVDPAELAKTRFALARALWDTPTDRDRPRALELAKLARTAFVDAGERAAEELDEVDSWLSEHATPLSPRPG